MSGDIWEEGAGATSRACVRLSGGGGGDSLPGLVWGGGGGWDTYVVQISMKNCHTKGSDSALESLSLTKLVSIKCSGVRGYLGRGELTSLPGNILVCGIWGREGCMTFGSDFNKKMRKNFKR
mgnify:CR=1 FL=1